MATPNSLAVIIARKGSKGLPNKAMQHLAGKPLVAWAIEHAMGSKRVDQVVLSSDCDDILSVGAS
jgi:N-acylneuraminate cytidylyltransferase